MLWVLLLPQLCQRSTSASAGLSLQLLLWDGVETFPATRWGAARSLPTQIPPTLPAQQWLKGRKAGMNPSAPSLQQQDSLITSLCCTSVNAVFLFSFFQAVQFLPDICWGQSFPPTLKLCPFASVENNNLLLLLFSSPKHGFLFHLHTLFLHKATQAVGAGNGQR